MVCSTCAFVPCGLLWTGYITGRPVSREATLLPINHYRFAKTITGSSLYLIVHTSDGSDPHFFIVWVFRGRCYLYLYCITMYHVKQQYLRVVSLVVLLVVMILLPITFVCYMVHDSLPATDTTLHLIRFFIRSDELLNPKLWPICHWGGARPIKIPIRYSSIIVPLFLQNSD